MTRLLLFIILASVCASLRPSRVAADDGFTPLFNGRDLTGWLRVNTAPGTFFVRDGEIVTTGKPYGYLRTDRMYENFIAEFEWMHVNKTEVGNSGFFVWGDALPVVGSPYTRGIEVQVLVNINTDAATSHGDVFSIQGATCKPDRPHPRGWSRSLPSERRAKGGGEWNHYKIVADNGSIKLHVNGKEVSGVSDCRPRKGYLALESEGAVCHFRNLKIKELPSTNPKPEETAKVDQGHTSLFDGLTLDGWKGEKDGWSVGGGMLKAAGKGSLTNEATFGKSELMFDWKSPAKSVDSFTVDLGGAYVVVSHANGGQLAVVFPAEGKETGGVRNVKGLKPGAWNRTVVTFDGTTATVHINGQNLGPVAAKKPLPGGPVVLHPTEGLEVMNLFIRELK